MSYLPAVDLGNGDYELDLMDFETYYILANINSTNIFIMFYFGNEEIVIPKGSYVRYRAVSEAWNFTFSREAWRTKNFPAGDSRQQ